MGGNEKKANVVSERMEEGRDGGKEQEEQLKDNYLPTSSRDNFSSGRVAVRGGRSQTGQGASGFPAALNVKPLIWPSVRFVILIQNESCILFDGND